MEMTQLAEHSDIFIAGGGPAGLAAAILARLRGFRVTVADHARPPIDKACGEGLMPDSVIALERLGVSLSPRECATFRGIRFQDRSAGVSVEANFLRGCGVGARRIVLHSKLVERAAELGVSLLWGARVNVSSSGQIDCDGTLVRSRWVIGADGENSQIRRWVAPQRPRYEQIRFGYRQHFRIAPWTDFVEVHWSQSCQIVVAPVAPDEVCVAVTSRSPQTGLAHALAGAPDLASRLAGVQAANPGRGARTALRRLKTVHRGSCALLGDASGSVDPLTGEGLGLAFQQAAALLQALQHGDLREYQAAHDRIGSVPRLTSRLMLLMDAHPWLKKRALRALEDEPALFSRLLNVQIQTLSLSDFGAWNALWLGWLLVKPGWQS
jgi:menaquinone-9 beta-reductase